MGKEEGGNLKTFLGNMTEVVAKYTGVDKEMISSGQLKAALQKIAQAVATKPSISLRKEDIEAILKSMYDFFPKYEVVAAVLVMALF